MSEPKRISPMLDGFRMGSPISEHDGVRCYPALKENSDKKYIVKIISIPASQVQLDALLLTGAYDDPGAAMDYFQELADGVAEEAQILKKLSKLEGFLPYDNWQVVPMEENRLGYQVYLISSYKRSLEKYLRRNTMTHLGAINLGLDMCSALAAARRAGYLYADLKPTNIFISGEKQYRIGDLGFLDLNGLKYTSLPSKYISAYTAPELKDALSTVNTTVDTYAVGMILYQIYNNGQLPNIVEEAPLAAPANADYELAEIIVKACASDPRDRFADPMEMGRALVAYMQRNRVNDVPIVPPAAEVEPETLPQNAVDETLPGEADAQDVQVETLSEETETMVIQAEELAAHEIPAPEAETETEPDPVPEEVSPVENTTEANVSESIIPEEVISEEPAASEEVPALEPTPAAKKKEKPVSKKKEPVHLKTKRDRRRHAMLIVLLVMFILALLAGGAFIFYREYYLQTIDAIQVDGARDEMTVILDTEIDNSLLTVTITDPNGNTRQAAVSNNQAHFDELVPDTLYKIRVDISGFHELDGVASHGYTSPAETSIASFDAKIGPEDGSALLSFAVTGPDTNDWIVTATAEGEEPISQTVSSHTPIITGLTVGKTYTFTLEPVAELFLVGDNTTEFTAAAVIMAENLIISDYGEGSLTVTWDAPADVDVTSWAVHCYSNDGVDMTLTTVETTATFGDIDTGREYTIEVLAAGMTEPARTSVSPDPAKLFNIQVDAEDETKLVVTWEYEGEVSDAGWNVMYSIDGSTPQGIVSASGTSAVIQPRIPGATYEFTIVPASGTSAFDNTLTYACPNAELFSYLKAGVSVHGINERMNANMLVRPEKSNWTYKDVSKSDYTTTFASGQEASLLLHLDQSFYTYHTDINIMYVFRDSNKKVCNDLVSQTVMDWSDMWNGANYRYCELDLPQMPTEAGSYTLYIYFNNQAISSIDFTITP